MRDPMIIFIDTTLQAASIIKSQMEQMLNQVEESGSAEFGPGSNNFDSCDSELENNELVVLTSIKVHSVCACAIWVYEDNSTN